MTNPIRQAWRLYVRLNEVLPDISDRQLGAIYGLLEGALDALEHELRRRALAASERAMEARR